MLGRKSTGQPSLQFYRAAQSTVPHCSPTDIPSNLYYQDGKIYTKQVDSIKRSCTSGLSLYNDVVVLWLHMYFFPVQGVSWKSMPTLELRETSDVCQHQIVPCTSTCIVPPERRSNHYQCSMMKQEMTKLFKCFVETQAQCQTAKSFCLVGEQPNPWRSSTTSLFPGLNQESPVIPSP